MHSIFFVAKSRVSCELANLAVSFKKYPKIHTNGRVSLEIQQR